MIVPSSVVSAVAGTPLEDVALAEGTSQTPDFTTVFRTYSPTSWRLLRRLGVAPGDVKDVCHEVFLVVHRKLAQIRDAASVRSFVYAVCVRAAADYRKSARVRHEILLDSMPEQVQSQGPEELLERREWAHYLRLVLGRMDEQKREVFVLYEMHDLSMAEIAQILGCPLQTAYSRLHAARDEIKQAFLSRETGGER